MITGSVPAFMQVQLASTLYSSFQTPRSVCFISSDIVLPQNLSLFSLISVFYIHFYVFHLAVFGDLPAALPRRLFLFHPAEKKAQTGRVK